MIQDVIKIETIVQRKIQDLDLILSDASLLTRAEITQVVDGDALEGRTVDFGLRRKKSVDLPLYKYKKISV